MIIINFIVILVSVFAGMTLNDFLRNRKPKSIYDCPICGRKKTRCQWQHSDMKCDYPCGAIETCDGRFFLGPEFLGYDEHLARQKKLLES